jgi:hypothetical protein
MQQPQLRSLATHVSKSSSGRTVRRSRQELLASVRLTLFLEMRWCMSDCRSALDFEQKYFAVSVIYVMQLRCEHAGSAGVPS